MGQVQFEHLSVPAQIDPNIFMAIFHGISTQNTHKNPVQNSKKKSKYETP